MFAEGPDQGRGLAECLSKLRVNSQPPPAAPPVNNHTAWQSQGQSWHGCSSTPLNPQEKQEVLKQTYEGKGDNVSRQLTSGHLCFSKKKSLSKRIKEKRYLRAQREWLFLK